MKELNNLLNLSGRVNSHFLDQVNKVIGVEFVDITIRVDKGISPESGDEFIQIYFGLKDKYNRLLAFKTKFSLVADMINPIPLDEKIKTSFNAMLADERGWRHYKNVNRIDIWKRMPYEH